ncbi:alpha/beta fold hydrolase [Pseudonocardia sp. GCM10023141]|uniref:alpha/beta fold hydrolase n=1 Tax=Pseudonocardia sp. GCM10023141 TaxID=3252653 RepID=UPI003608E7A6
MTDTTTVTAATLAVPGALLHYEVRGAGPLIALIGAPMDAAAFAPLADLLATDHTVLTSDPRGANRSTIEDRDADSTPEIRADDLARLLTHLDAGPAVVLGSSGGAVTTLALVQARPDLLHTAIAHEPPLINLLDDRDEVRAATDDMCATYLGGDHLGAWRKFMANANIELPPGVLEHMFGDDRDPKTLAGEHFWFAHELRPSTYWNPDLHVLRSSPVRIVAGIGDASTGQECDRTTTALAARLGIEPTLFPGGHTGFVDDPQTFVVRLRAVLDEN